MARENKKHEVKKYDRRKKYFIVVSFIAAFAMVFSSIAFGFKTTQSAENSNQLITATLEKTQISALSKITVNLTDLGVSSYPDTKKYQIYDGDKAVSPVTTIDEPTAVFPAKKSGESITVKLLKDDKTEIAETTVKLSKK